MRPMRRSDHDETLKAIGIALGKRETHHPAVRRTDERAYLADPEVVEHSGDRIRLVVRGDDAFRPAVAALAAVQEIQAQELSGRGVERAPVSGDGVPPTGARVGGAGAHVAI